MIDAESEAVKIPKLGGGKSHSGYPNPKSQYPPGPKDTPPSWICTLSLSVANSAACSDMNLILFLAMTVPWTAAVSHGYDGN